jgi:hypothetical protein
MFQKETGVFDPEEVSFESVSTENSEEENASNRSYVPCGVGVTVQVRCHSATIPHSARRSMAFHWHSLYLQCLLFLRFIANRGRLVESARSREWIYSQRWRCSPLDQWPRCERKGVDQSNCILIFPNKTSIFPATVIISHIVCCTVTTHTHTHTKQRKEDVAALLQGRAGTTVNVEVLREGTREPVKVKLTRHYKSRKPARVPRQPRSGGGTSSNSRSPRADGMGWDGQPSPPSSQPGSQPGRRREECFVDVNTKKEKSVKIINCLINRPFACRFQCRNIDCTGCCRQVEEHAISRLLRSRAII